MSDPKTTPMTEPNVAQHSPRPWRAVPLDDKINIVADNGTIVATMPRGWDGKSHDGCNPTRIANAFLIAGAVNAIDI